MKQKAIFTLLFSMVLILSGCKGIDEVGPVFENIPEVLTFEFNTEVDLLDLGISAFDDVDGDVTNNITINMDKDITDVGTYDVVYTISDEALNVTELSIQIVIEDTTAPVITVNPDGLRTLFEIGAIEPNWRLYFGLQDEEYSSTIDYGSRLSINTQDVDMDVVGPFSVLVTFTDIYGNTSNEISINVIMIEIE